MDAVITSTAPLIIIELLAVLLKRALRRCACGVLHEHLCLDGAAVGAFETSSVRYACGFARVTPWPLDGRLNLAARRFNGVD